MYLYELGHHDIAGLNWSIAANGTLESQTYFNRNSRKDFITTSIYDNWCTETML